MKFLSILHSCVFLLRKTKLLHFFLPGGSCGLQGYSHSSLLSSPSLPTFVRTNGIQANDSSMLPLGQFDGLRKENAEGDMKTELLEEL